jgi:excisionase family DNA binding protein
MRSPADPPRRGAANEITLVDPRWWLHHRPELLDALRAATAPGETPRSGGTGSTGIMASGERLTLSVEEAADQLGISRALAYEAVRRGQIPHVRIGRRILVPKVALQRLLGS